jgi:hypothetical protein
MVDVVGNALDGRRIMRAEGYASPGCKLKGRLEICACCRWDGHHVECCCDSWQHVWCAGKQLVVRPVLESFPDAHYWSIGGSDGSHSIRLDTLDEGQTRLLACMPVSLSQPGS